MAGEKTAAELQAEERELAIKRGDIIPDEEPEVKADDDAGEVPEGEGDGEPEAEASDDASDGDPEPVEAASDPEGEEVDGDAKAEGDGEGDGKEKPIMIPKARFDEAQQKARDKVTALEAKLAKAEADQIVKTTNEDVEKLESAIEALEDEWEGHLLEGETEKAKAARHELNAKRRELTQTMVTQQSQQSGNAAVEQIRYETKLAVFEEKFPIINPDSADYDPEVEAEVGELKSAFEAQGWGSTAALEKAIRYVPALNQPEAPAPTLDPEVKKSQRAHKARKAAAAASKASPPDASKAGRDSDKGGKGDGLPDVTKMSPDQFAKWAESDPSALAKLRGDTLSAEEAAG